MGNQPQHRNEGERIAEAHHRPCRHRHREYLGERKCQLTDDHEDSAGQDHRLGAEAVQQDSGRDLSGGIHGELQHDEGRQNRRAGVESLGRLQTGDPERRAVHHRDGVGE